MRLVGPNCLGVLVPGAKLNASFAVSMSPPGDLALISQSGAIAAGLAEWAAARAIGFSAVVSIGDSIDVDFADLLDYFALDRDARHSALRRIRSGMPASSCRRRAPRRGRGEYAVLVRSDLKSHGLGWLLMQTIIEYARAEGIRMIEGQVLRENTTMLKMCRELGFEIASDPEEADVQVVRLKL